MRARAARCERRNAAALRNAMSERKLDLRVVELLYAGALGVGGGDALHLDDLDAIRLSAMTSAHVAVALRDGAGHRDVAIFAVHVVMAGTRVVTQPNAVVLDAARLALLYLECGRLPKTCRCLAFTSLHEITSPCVFLTRRSIDAKYQKRDLATTLLLAKICIL